MDFLICLWYLICIVGSVFYFTEAGIAFRLNNTRKILISLLIFFIFIFLGFLPKLIKIFHITI